VRAEARVASYTIPKFATDKVRSKFLRNTIPMREPVELVLYTGMISYDVFSRLLEIVVYASNANNCMNKKRHFL
jgi:hypothetical protein